MDLRVSKTVRRIVVIHPEQEGRWHAETLYRKKQRKKKKGTRLLRPLEKRVRTQCKANRKACETYEKQHKKSNRQRRDGWLRDLNYNVYRTVAKKAKILKRPLLLRSYLSRTIAKKAGIPNRPSRMFGRRRGCRLWKL